MRFCWPKFHCAHLFGENGYETNIDMNLSIISMGLLGVKAEMKVPIIFEQHAELLVSLNLLTEFPILLFSKAKCFQNPDLICGLFVT